MGVISHPTCINIFTKINIVRGGSHGRQGTDKEDYGRS